MAVRVAAPAASVVARAGILKFEPGRTGQGPWGDALMDPMTAINSMVASNLAEVHREASMKSASKWIQIVLLATLVFFVIQYLLMGLLAAAWSLDMIMKAFVYLGAAPLGSPIHRLLRDILLVLLYPICFLTQKGSSGNWAVSLSVVLLMANSVIWGVFVGSLVFAFGKKRGNSKSTKSS